MQVHEELTIQDAELLVDSLSVNNSESAFIFGESACVLVESACVLGESACMF